MSGVGEMTYLNPNSALALGIFGRNRQYAVRNHFRYHPGSVVPGEYWLDVRSSSISPKERKLFPDEAKLNVIDSSTWYRVGSKLGKHRDGQDPPVGEGKKLGVLGFQESPPNTRHQDR